MRECYGSDTFLCILLMDLNVFDELFHILLYNKLDIGK